MKAKEWLKRGKQAADPINALSDFWRGFNHVFFPLAGDDEKAKMQREGELLSRRLQRGNDDLNEELNAAQGEIVDGIGRKMLEVLDRYSRENGYTAVLDTSAQGSPVVYGSSQSDITQEIVRLYDQAYPIKGGSAAAPAAPKPAAPAPAPAKKPTP